LFVTPSRDFVQHIGSAEVREASGETNNFVFQIVSAASAMTRLTNWGDDSLSHFLICLSILGKLEQEISFF
jgi:hypothetical protein